MPTDVKTPSTLVGAIPLVPPTDYPVAVPATKPKVSPAQQGVLIQVSDIAEHDRKLADSLRARLDFGDVLEGGSRLSAADAHGVLGWSDYERFEIIRSGVMARDQAQSTANTILGVTAGALALTIGSVLAFTDVSPWAVTLFGLLGSMVGMMIAAETAENTVKEGKERFAGIAGKLAALNALPAEETPKRETPAAAA